jgi:hypothetical protein
VKPVEPKISRRKYISLHPGIGLFTEIDRKMLEKPEAVVLSATPSQTLRLTLKTPHYASDPGLSEDKKLAQTDSETPQMLGENRVAEVQIRSRVVKTGFDDLSRFRILGALLFDLFLLASVSASVWVFGRLFPHLSQPLVEAFWKIARANKLDWWLVARSLPEFFWPVCFWSSVLLILLQSAFVLLAGATAGKSFFGVRLLRDGFWPRIGLWASEFLTLCGLLSFPWAMMFPKRVPVFFWLQFRSRAVI